MYTEGLVVTGELHLTEAPESILSQIQMAANNTYLVIQLETMVRKQAMI